MSQPLCLTPGKLCAGCNSSDMSQRNCIQQRRQVYLFVCLSLLTLKKSCPRSYERLPLRFHLSDRLYGHVQTKLWKGGRDYCNLFKLTVVLLLGPGLGWGAPFPDHMGVRAPRQNQGRPSPLTPQHTLLRLYMCTCLHVQVWVLREQTARSATAGSLSLQCVSWEQWEGSQFSCNNTNKN